MFRKKGWIFLICSTVAVAATAITIFSLSGCGKKIVVTKILSHMAEKDDAMQKLAKSFNEWCKQKGKSQKVEVQSIGGGADYVANLQSKLGSNGVTCFMVQGMGEMQQFKDFADTEIIKTLTFLAKAQPEILESYIDNEGNYCAFPVAIEYYGYLVWKDMLKACGIVDLIPLRKFDKFKDSVGLIKQKIESGELKKSYPNVETPMASFGKEGWALCTHTFHVPIGKEFGSERNAYNSKTLEFKYADDYMKVVELQTKNSVPGEPTADRLRPLLAADYTSAIEKTFKNKQAVMTQQGNWVTAQMSDEEKKNLDMIPFSMPSEPDGKYVVFASQGWMFNKKSSEEERRVAAEFLEYIYSQERLKYLVEEMKMISPYATKEELEQTKAMSEMDMKVLDEFRAGKFFVGGCGLARGEKLTMDVLLGCLQKWIASGEPEDKFNEMVVEPVKSAWQKMASGNKAAN